MRPTYAIMFGVTIGFCQRYPALSTLEVAIVGKSQFYRVLIAFIALVFLSVGILSGFAMATHSCANCANETRPSCSAIIMLRNISRYLSETLLGIAAFAICATSLHLAIFLTPGKIYAPSPVGLRVRMNN